MALEDDCIITSVYQVLEKLKETHFKKIELSDAILTVNVNNYNGYSTNL